MSARSFYDARARRRAEARATRREIEELLGPPVPPLAARSSSDAEDEAVLMLDLLQAESLTIDIGHAPEAA